MIRTLFKFDKNIPRGALVIDTTSNSGGYRQLSPFTLPAPPAYNFENLWQFSKVYPEHIDGEGNPLPCWYQWRDKGFANRKACRYPMGKGRIPFYSYWGEQKLGYIDARKQIYATEYAINVRPTLSFKSLNVMYNVCLSQGRELVLLDYDAYDYTRLGMSLIEVINNPNRKMGHAFVLIMMLTGLLEDCISSPPT